MEQDSAVIPPKKRPKAASFVLSPIKPIGSAQEGSILAIGDLSLLSVKITFNSSTYSLYTVNNPSLSNNGMYLAVANGNAYNATGSESVAGVTSFGGHEALADYIYTYSNSQLTNSSETQSVSYKDGKVLASNAEFFIGTLSLTDNKAFNLYSVTVSGSYYKIDIEHQNDPKFNSQYIDSILYSESGTNSVPESPVVPEIQGTTQVPEVTAPEATTAPTESATVPPENENDETT